MDQVKVVKSSRIRIKIQQSILKEGFDILTKVNSGECHFNFTKDGFSISCVTAIQQQGKKGKKASAEITKRSQVDYYFPAADLPKYDYRVLAKDSKPIPHYECKAKTLDFSLRIKGLKKPVISMTLTFVNGSCPEIAFKTQGSSGITLLEISQVVRRTTYVNQLEAWFKDKLPASRPECSAFQMMIQSAKQNKCTEVEFCLNKRTKNVSVRGWGASGMVFADPMGDVGSTSSYEADAEDDVFISRHINLAQHEWIGHVPKMCQESIVGVYIKDDPDAPLIMTAYLGHQGKAVFSIPDSTV